MSTHVRSSIYLNAPSLVKDVVIYICAIAHSVYRIDNMVNTADTSREDKFVTRHFIVWALTKTVKYKSAFHTYFINMSVKVQRNETTHIAHDNIITLFIFTGWLRQWRCSSQH